MVPNFWVSVHFVPWLKEWISFLFVDGSIHPKKMTKNCIIARSAWWKVSVFFSDGYSIQTKQINLYLIIELYENIDIMKYKLYFLWFVYAPHTLWRLSVLWRLSITSQIDGYKNPPDISTNRKALYIEN
jgi:hypothetical protein